MQTNDNETLATFANNGAVVTGILTMTTSRNLKPQQLVQQLLEL